MKRKSETGRRPPSIQRRDLIALLGGAAVAWPQVASAQQGRKRIGVLLPGEREETAFNLNAFEDGLRRFGLEDGRNVDIDVRWSGTDRARMTKDAKEIVASHPDVILVSTGPLLAVVRQAGPTIPTVFTMVGDPVELGFVNSLAHPGGNITGFLNYEAAMSGKWMSLLKELAPDVTRAALMYNPNTTTTAPMFLKAAAEAGKAYGIAPVQTPVRDDEEIDTAIASFAAAPGGGIIVLPDIFFITDGPHAAAIIESSSHHRVPATYSFPDYASKGGLLGYGLDISDLFRRAADYVDRILKGANPADLPVQAPTKFILAINLKTAKALGLTVPTELLATADEVIE